jgi:uncharacterized DUF497 family protein
MDFYNADETADQEDEDKFAAVGLAYRSTAAAVCMCCRDTITLQAFDHRAGL